MTVEDWAARAASWITDNPPPLGAPPGSRTPKDAAEHREWTDWSRRLHAAGLAVTRWPREWGGAEATADEAWSVTEVLAAAGAPLPLSDIGINLVGPALMAAGNPEQKARHLPPIAAGTVVWAQLFSEPETGSDLAAVGTAARPDGEDWVVTGQKVWNTYAHLADWGFLIARTGTREDRHRGLTAFLVPMDLPGIRVRPLREITGHADFNEVFLDDVRLGPEHVLGAPGEGWKVAMELLVDERHVIGRHVIGLSAELDRLVSVLDADAEPEAAFLVGELCASARGVLALAAAPDLPAGAEIMAKIAFSELNIDVHQAAIDLVARGGEAVPAGWADRWMDGYLYTRGYTISGGANEVMRNVLAKRVLGLPR